MKTSMSTRVLRTEVGGIFEISSSDEDVFSVVSLLTGIGVDEALVGFGVVASAATDEAGERGLFIVDAEGDEYG